LRRRRPSYAKSRLAPEKADSFTRPGLALSVKVPEGGKPVQYYSPLYSCLNPSDDPVVSEDLIREEINYVEEHESLSPKPGAKEKKARALASIRGHLPPYMIYEYFGLDYWSRYTGTVLIAGFRPDVLAGVELSQLTELQGERVLEEVLEEQLNSSTLTIPCKNLCRLDGVNGKDLTGQDATPNLHGFEISRDDGSRLFDDLLIQLWLTCKQKNFR